MVGSLFCVMDRAMSHNSVQFVVALARAVPKPSYDAIQQHGFYDVFIEVCKSLISSIFFSVGLGIRGRGLV